MCVEAGRGRRTVTEIGLNEPKVETDSKAGSADAARSA